MILRSPTKDENGAPSHVFPRLVIPAQAGIQVSFPPQLAWIPAGVYPEQRRRAGMTERCGYSAYSDIRSIAYLPTRIFEGGHEEHEVSELK